MKLRLDTHTAALHRDDRETAPADEIAAFERLWLLRTRGLVLEMSAALGLVSELSYDSATSGAILAGDAAARKQMLDAYTCLTSLEERLEALGPAPQRFSAVQSILAGAFRSFATAADAFATGTEDTVDLDVLARIPSLMEEGRAMLDELHRGNSAAVSDNGC